jgi:FKBP-type peptidyl-prolyl cis-trans isomerase
MKLLTLLLGILFIFSTGCSKDEKTAEKLRLKDDRDKLSYAYGIEIGKNMTRQSLDLNADAVAQGVNDSLTGSGTLIPEKEAFDLVRDFRNDMRLKEKARLKEIGETNKEEGSKFLAENSKKEGVVTTASGLQYKILTPGTGRKPALTDTVTIHYTGTLINGKEFDSSYKRGMTSDMKLSTSIQGFAEGIQLMKEGGTWEFYLPYDLAYGSRSAGSEIGPYATLIFKVELIKIKEPGTTK